MRIAQIAPLYGRVPPTTYGGTERVVDGLTEELVRRGHTVILFASGDSETSAQLVACCRRGLRLDPDVRDYIAYTIRELGRVSQRAGEFDLIHNHIDYFAFPHSRLVPTPMLTTGHGRLDLPEVIDVCGDFPEVRLVSISTAQRAPLPRANWLATVYNGVDLGHCTFRERPGRLPGVPRAHLPGEASRPGDRTGAGRRYASPHRGESRSVERMVDGYEAVYQRVHEVLVS